MNGVHDMGGMHGFGPVSPEPEASEAVFHTEWERRVFGLALATAPLGLWSLDASRHSRERLDPLTYLGSSYYEKWLAGLESLLVEHDVVSPDELASATSDGPAADALVARRLAGDHVAPMLESGRPYDRPSHGPPRFAPGDRVRVLPVTTAGHTRAVGYARGRFGTIEVHHGCHVFPDRSADGEDVGEHLYGVAFAATELWGAAASAGDTVHIELWEPYLEAAS